jgi:hypothetical protein
MNSESTPSITITGNSGSTLSGNTGSNTNAGTEGSTVTGNTNNTRSSVLNSVTVNITQSVNTLLGNLPQTVNVFEEIRIMRRNNTLSLCGKIRLIIKHY